MTQGGDWSNTIKYEYLEFDEYGNWTKRNVIITAEGWYESANGIMAKHKTTTKEKQTAEYTYWDNAVKFVPVTPTTGLYTVTGATLNVRSGAGSSFAKLGTLSQNATVEVLEVSGEWGKSTTTAKTAM